MNFLKNMRVLMQVSLISLIAFVGFGIVGAIYYVSLTQQEAIDHETAFRQNGKDTLDKIAYDFLNARRAEKDFLGRLDEKYTTKHSEIVNATRPLIKKLRQFHTEAATQAKIDLISAKFDAYGAQFIKVADDWRTFGLNEKSGLRGSLRTSVHGVEAKLKQYNRLQLTVTMLMMRRHEKDFFLRVNEKYLGRMDKRLAEFQTQLAASSMPQSVKIDISKLMTSYHNDFKAAAQVRLSLVGSTKLMSKLFADVAPAIAAIGDDAASDLAMSQARSATIASTTQTLMYGAMLSIAVLVGMLSTVVGRTLAGSVIGMTNAMETLANGNTNIVVPAQDQKNEIGHMAHATNVFKENMIENTRLSEERKLQHIRREQRTEKMDALTKDFGVNVSDALNSVERSAGSMETTALSMSDTAKQTAQKSNIVSSASEEASSNVETVAAATEELSSSIQEISRQVVQSTTIAATAVEEVENTNEKIHGLAEAANKIGEVVAMITDIADQTNLLALNATIEAARAGDAGKGFAVVASEVKNLANQTAKATEEISSQISSVQGATQDAVTAIGSIGGTITQLNEISSAIAAAVEEQGAATQEIARNVEQAANGTSQVSENITEVTQAAEQTGVSSHDVLTAANGMSGEAKALKQQVDAFLAEIRSL